MAKADGSSGDDSNTVIRKTVTIVNQRGLHARAAARFVKVAARFNAQVRVAKNGTVVSGLSIMGLMMLAAGPGSDIEIQASGAEAHHAVAALDRLVANKFNEE